MENDRDLLERIRSQFELDWDGIHGLPHWLRVRDNGLRLAELTGANRRVVELFALLHDSQRWDDGYDPDHGPRAAEFLRELAGDYFHLDPPELELLEYACHYHSDGYLHGDITVVTCWDADRLDLGRVGMRPRAEYLCTAAAQEPAVIEWAFTRSISRER